MKLKAPAIPQSFLLFLMTVALTAGACRCLRIYWQAFSLVLISGFIIFAQEAISKYFEHPAPDKWIQYSILVASVGYAMMFYFCIVWTNETAGAEIFGGFILFLRKLLKESMNGYHDTPPVSPATTTEPPKGTPNV